MERYLVEYERWLENVKDENLLNELNDIKGNVSEIEDRFYRECEFGTGGLRGVIGAGTNRMNVYVVAKATQGLSNYINKNGLEKKVAIAYDSRNFSQEFAKKAAEILAANGIKVFLYDVLTPTPVLSFAVRELSCGAGIVITASHNPSKYNGYKVYGSDGCQITTEAAETIYNEIVNVDVFKDIKTGDFNGFVNAENIVYIGDEVKERFYSHVLSQQINKGICEKADLKVVYTPLNGTGNVPVRRVLKEIGVNNITVVKEQEMPNGNFPTCPYPNPEIEEANKLAIELAQKEKPDIVLATDPDCDRVGVCVLDEGEYKLMGGNETGALLLDYILSQRTKQNTMPKNPVTIKTIVTTGIVYKIAKEYNVKVVDVLTGFKFIGEQIGLLEKDGREDDYVFGYEESYGYLIGSYVRDKDAVCGSMLICEMAAYYKTLGISLIQALDRLYKKYGYYAHSLDTFVYEGVTGADRMKEIMNNLRENPVSEINGLKVLSISDYLKSKTFDLVNGAEEDILLPKSDVLLFRLEKDNQFIVRPSGTEPKLKVYIIATGEDALKADEMKKNLKNSVKEILM